MTKEKQQLTMIVALAAAQVLHETLDDLEDTNFYRQSLKNATKKFQKELTKSCDHYINALWKVDETVMQGIQDGIIEVAKEIATMDPARIAVIGDLLKNESITYIDKTDKE